MKKLTLIAMHVGIAPLATTVVDAHFQDYLDDGRPVGWNVNAHFSLAETQNLSVRVGEDLIRGDLVAKAFLDLIAQFADRTHSVIEANHDDGQTPAD